jgi:hypothetical protein
MRWRGITKNEVERVLDKPESVIKLSSDKANYFKTLKGRCIRVTAICETHRLVVITAVIKV